MILLTGTQRDRLLANGRQRDQDHIPVVKFFNPLGDGVWLATELDGDGVGVGRRDVGVGGPQPEQVGRDEQVARGGDRDELGQSLDDAQNDALDQIHSLPFGGWLTQRCKERKGDRYGEALRALCLGVNNKDSLCALCVFA